MIFGPFDLSGRPRDGGGLPILAHSVRTAELRMAKGTRLDGEAIARLREAGLTRVEAAVPEPGDIDEDEAARLCAEPLLVVGAALGHDRATTGRVNLRAGADGLFRADARVVDALNAIDDRLTVATLPDGTRVRSGELVATVKVIPFHVPRAGVERWRMVASDAAAAGRGIALEVRPWLAMAVLHVATVLPGTRTSVLDKTRRALAGRIGGTRGELRDERRVPHERAALAQGLREAMSGGPESAPRLIVIFGASAITDARDVVPEAIRMAGGTVERVGMPVDPGNLLVLGRLGDAVVIGAPGCARSPVHNGFDLVLDRVLAGIGIGADEIGRWGVGGLLKEIKTRPRPREGEAPLDAPADGAKEEAKGEGTGEGG